MKQEILELSLKKFEWKTSGQFDKLENLFDKDMAFVHLTGNSTSSADWMRQLRNGTFVYTKIDHEDSEVKVYGDTAVLVGRATFTVNGGSIFRLIYTEVYTKKNGEWKLVNLHTTSR